MASVKVPPHARAGRNGRGHRFAAYPRCSVDCRERHGAYGPAILGEVSAMQKALFAAAALFLILHGLIHLMGTTAYLRLGRIEALPYKTTLLGGSWSIGDRGIRVFGVLWAIPALGFVVAGVAMLAGWTLWPALTGVMAVLSLVLTLLDWSVAYAGAVINVVVLGMLWLGPVVSAWLSR